MYKYDISLFVSNNDSGGGFSHSEVESNHYLFTLRRQHLEHGTMQPNQILRVIKSSTPWFKPGRKHRSKPSKLTTILAIFRPPPHILLLITIKSWNQQPLSSSPEKPESTLLPIKMIILFVLCWILGETSSDHMGKVSLIMLAIPQEVLASSVNIPLQSDSSTCFSELPCTPHRCTPPHQHDGRKQQPFADVQHTVHVIIPSFPWRNQQEYGGE